MKKLVLAVAAALSLNAQTLDSFIKEVLAKNPEISSLESQYKASEEEAAISGKWDNPVFGVQVTNIDFSSPAKRDIEPMQQVMYSISQNVPVNSKFAAKESAKKMMSEAAKNRLTQKKLDIEFEIKKTAYELAKAEETKKVYEKYFQTLKFALDIARASNLDAETSHIELIRGDMEITSFMRKLTDIDSQIQILQKSLASFGVKPASEISVDLDMPNKKASSVSFETSNDYAVLDYELKSAQKELKAERLSAVPDIGVSVGYASSDVKFRDYWFFGISIPLPIYGKENSSIRKKAFELSAKQEEKENVKNKLELELESSKIKLQNAQKNYALTNKILKTQVGHLLESAISSSRSMPQSRMYLISTIKDALSLELELIDYKYDANVALAQIKKISGHEI